MVGTEQDDNESEEFFECMSHYEEENNGEENKNHESSNEHADPVEQEDEFTDKFNKLYVVGEDGSIVDLKEYKKVNR